MRQSLAGLPFPLIAALMIQHAGDCEKRSLFLAGHREGDGESEPRRQHVAGLCAHAFYSQARDDSSRDYRDGDCQGTVRWLEPYSLFNCLNATLLEVLKVIVHFFELVGRMTFPIGNLSDDAKCTPRTV